MAALLYFVSAIVVLAMTHRWFAPLTRGAAVALLLLPLLFTGRAVLTNRIYAPVEMPYLAQPFVDHAADMHVGRPHNLMLADIAFQMIPWREATRRALAAGDWPLLNRFQMSGDVLAAGGQPAVFNPFTLIACLLPSPISFTYTGAIAFFLAGLGAFVFARELGCSVIASMFAAAGWMFCVPVALQVLWPLGFAWILFPMILAATHRVVHAPSVRSAAWLAGVLSLEIVAGHPETLLHVTAIGAIYGVFELTRAKSRIAAVVAAIASGIVAFGLTAIAMLPFLDAMQQTQDAMTRSIFSQVPLRIPEGFQRSAWLGDFFPWLEPARVHLPGDAVAGSIIFALAVYAILFVHSRTKWFFVAVMVYCLFAGTQTWPVAQLLHAIPGFGHALNERLASAVPLCYAVLAAFAIDDLRPRRAAIICAAIAIVYAIVAVTAPKPITDRTRFVAEIVPLAICAALLVLRTPNPKLRTAIVFTLILIQRVIADGSLIPINDARIAYPDLPVMRPMKNVREPFRFAGAGAICIPNTATMYGLEDVRGNTPMMLARMYETFPLWSRISTQEFHGIPDLGKPFLAAMNVRFALLDVSAPIPPGWRDVTHDVWTRLIENERVLNRAFIPRRVRIGATPKAEIEEMGAETDFGTRAWIAAAEEWPQERDNGTGSATTRLESNNSYVVDVNKHGDGFVVISESAWGGWRAYLDGRRVRISRANHAFLSVFVPDGKHTIRLRFLPQSFVVGRAITFATLLLIAIYSTVTLFARFRGWSTSHPRRSAM